MPHNLDDESECARLLKRLDDRFEIQDAKMDYQTGKLTGIEKIVGQHDLFIGTVKRILWLILAAVVVLVVTNLAAFIHFGRTP